MQLSENLEAEIVKTKIMQIRIKGINFMEQQTTAIYFYDMTHHFDFVK